MAYKFTTGSVNRGDLYAEKSIDDDGDTYINFGDDSISLVANAVNVLEVGTAGVILNEGAAGAMDFRVESTNEDEAIFLNAGNDTLHINKGSSAFSTTIYGNSSFNITHCIFTNCHI